MHEEDATKKRRTLHRQNADRDNAHYTDRTQIEATGCTRRLQTVREKMQSERSRGGLDDRKRGKRRGNWGARWKTEDGWSNSRQKIGGASKREIVAKWEVSRDINNVADRNDKTLADDVACRIESTDFCPLLLHQRLSSIFSFHFNMFLKKTFYFDPLVYEFLDPNIYINIYKSDSILAWNVKIQNFMEWTSKNL